MSERGKGFFKPKAVAVFQPIFPAVLLHRAPPPSPLGCTQDSPKTQRGRNLVRVLQNKNAALPAACL